MEIPKHGNRGLDAKPTSEHLAAAAAAGDLAAAGRFFAENLPFFSSMARKVAGSSAFDPADLLAETMLRVIEKWAVGQGPTEHAVAYVVQTMRNQMKDFLKSPRSHVETFDPDLEISEPAEEALHQVEIRDDLEIVRSALALMPEDQQRVLRATVIEGRKPGELVEELGRPAPAIYSLLRRAKLGLRRTMLRVLLEGHAPEECRKAAAGLPESVPDDPTDLPAAGRTRHYKECVRCRLIWGRFARMALLGVLPLLVLSGVLDTQAVPAQANGVGEDPRPTSVEGNGRAASGRAARHRTPLGKDPGSARYGEPSHKIRALIRRRSFGNGALGVLALGTVLLTFVGVAALTRTLWFTPGPDASLQVDSEADGGALLLGVEFEVPGHRWHTERMDIELTKPIEAIIPPEGWTCRVNGATAHCTTSWQNTPGGAIRVVPVASGPLGYQLAIEATVETGYRAVGTASGELHLPDA